MSGVLALFHRDGKLAQPADLAPLFAAGAHRAIDGAYATYDGPAALGQQRFDPWERGFREGPLEKGSRILVADLRIDNRGELLSQLELPRETGDMGLLLASYEKWDTDCVHHLLGDFAFVLWDRSKRRLFFARDPLGVRDLAYHLSPSLCVVASEVAQVSAHSEVVREPDEIKMALYLASSWQDQERTFFSSVKYCPPGECVVVEQGTHRRWKYWQPRPSARIHYRDEREYVEHFRQVFRQSVRDRLPAFGNPTVGLSLSGGLDSVCLAAELAEQGVTVAPASWTFDRYPSCDERRWIEPALRHLGLPGKMLSGDDLGPLSAPLEVFPDFAGQDPFQRLALGVAQTVRDQGCRLLFTGHYGDLLFSGGDHWAGEMIGEGRFGEFARLSFSHRKDSLRSLRRVLGASLPRPPSGWRHLRGRLHPRLLENPEALAALGHTQPGSESPGARHRRLAHLTLAAIPQGEGAARRSYHRLGLERVDPYCDRRLVELVLAFPADQLARPPWTKWLLRRAFQGRLPNEILHRRGKTSLLALFENGLERRRPLLKNTLTKGQVVARQLVETKWLQREATPGTVPCQAGYPLWLTLTLEAWLQALAGEEQRHALAA